MKVMRDLVGETLSSRYRLIARVAGGGMGEVYRGHDLLLDRTVAVKVLQANLAADPHLVARFKAEARAAARLTHPNVVAVYDWGAEDDLTYYMVMEYVSGTDLRDVLVTRGSVGVEQSVEVAASVCDALAAAHAGGLVHRDVKPENVLIARSGTVKVADFGIAAVVDVDRTQPGGSISGTLRYLSPEQAAGRDATTASDIWAAGALLSEMLTGMPPLQGAGPDLLRRRAMEPPLPPSSFEERVPAAVDAIVLQACSIDPAQRFASAVEMGSALRRVATQLPVATPLEELLEEVTGEIRIGDMAPTDFAPRSTRRTPMSRNRRFLLAFLVALIAVGGGRGVAALLAPQQIEVPELVGLTRAEAASVTEDAGLEMEITRRIHDFGSEAGTVLYQDPERGTVTEGGTIGVVVSLGPHPVNVPTLTGLPLDVALVRLRASQLDVGEVTHRYSIDEEGTVIDQRPVEGRLDWGSKVDLVVSRGPRSIGVPDVTGMTVPKARAVLEEAGFEVTVVDVFSDDIKVGRVVETVPATGTSAPEGSTIEVRRSKGPEFEELVLPDVRGMAVDAARAQLEGLGLRVYVQEVSPGCAQGGTVVDTDPLPGETVRENDRVALFC